MGYLRDLFFPLIPMAPESVTPKDEWQVYGHQGWTMEQVTDTVASLDAGSLRYADSLLLAMQRNPLFRHGMSTYINATLGVEWQLEGGGGLPEQQKLELAAHLPDLWAGGHGANGLAVTTKYRATLGVGPANVTWKLSPSGRTWLPVLHAKEAGNLTYYAPEARYKFQARDQQYWVIPDGKEWLLFTEPTSMYPHLEGNLRTLAVPWHMLEQVVRLWQNYNKVHGSPQRKIKVPGKQRENDDVRALVKEAQTLMGGSVVTCPQYPNGLSFDFELVAAQFSTYETFPKMIDYVERWFTLVWLGAIDNTQGGPAGSRARAQVHERVSLQYLAAACRVTAAPLRTLLRQWCRYNRLDPALAPVLTPLWQPRAYEREAADVRFVNAQALGQAAAGAQLVESHGVPVDWHELAEQHGLPLARGVPERGEEPGEELDASASLRPRRILARCCWDTAGERDAA